MLNELKWLDLEQFNDHRLPKNIRRRCFLIKVKVERKVAITMDLPAKLFVSAIPIFNAIEAERNLHGPSVQVD